ncbi:hypothetical protein [Marinobacter sp.]|uniref:hypothetical protein n=1 Tax=Marinobacter sp. TaxID=50741 RepID=UPI003A8DD5B2
MRQSTGQSYAMPNRWLNDELGLVDMTRQRLTLLFARPAPDQGRQLEDCGVHRQGAENRPKKLRAE